MIRRTYDLEFLTPCFCAGADQTHAELRPASIRGQIRWWFRSLGGSPAEERETFGSVHGGPATASSFSIRAQHQPGNGQRDWHTTDNIPKQGMEPKTYLLGFFCGRTGRLQAGGALPPGAKARLQLTFRRPPSPKLDQALRIFFSVGALGFRATRAAGAFASAQHELTGESWPALATDLESAGFRVVLLKPEFRDWVQLIHHAGSLLKNKLRGQDGLAISAGSNGSKPNALGSAEPRQSSVLHLRPVRIDHRLRLALLEAPHQRILGQPALRAHGNRGSIIASALQRNLITA